MPHRAVIHTCIHKGIQARAHSQTGLSQGKAFVFNLPVSHTNISALLTV